MDLGTHFPFPPLEHEKRERDDSFGPYVSI